MTWTREEDLPTPGIVTTLDGSIAWWLNVLWALEPPPGAYGEHGVYARRGPQEHTLLEVADWIEAERPDLNRFDWPAAVLAAREWHRRFSLTAGYRQPVAPGNTVLLARWPDGATLVQLTSKFDFAAEGTSMGHCVGGNRDADGFAPGDGHYWNLWRDGKAVLISYRDATGLPRATLELGRNELAQDGGRSDLDLTYLDQAQGPGDGPLDLLVAMRLYHWYAPVFVKDYLRSYETLTQLIHGLIDGHPFVPDDTGDIQGDPATLKDLLEGDDPFGLWDFGEILTERVDAVRLDDGPIEMVLDALTDFRKKVGQHTPAGKLDMEEFVNLTMNLAIHLVSTRDESYHLMTLGGGFQAYEGADGSSQGLTPWFVMLDVEVPVDDSAQFTWRIVQTENREDGPVELDVYLPNDNPFQMLRTLGLLKTRAEAGEALTEMARHEDADVDAVERVAEPTFRPYVAHHTEPGHF